MKHNPFSFVAPATASQSSSLPFVTIDLGTIVNNIRYLQTYAKNIAPVVKTDAYGLGAIQVVERLYAHHIKEFFVAYFEEGVILRENVPGDYRIYVLNDVKKRTRKDYEYFNLIPVLYDQESIHYWKQHGHFYPCAVHFDTGMHRTGASITTPIDHLNVVLVMSHLSISEDASHPMNEQQLKLFSSIPTKARRSLANSGGIFLGPSYHFDLVRSGIACYGFIDFGHPEIKNCMKVFAHVLQIDHVTEGYVGYCMQYEITRPTVIATLGFGHADGAPLYIKYVKFGEYKAPVIGKVSMDLLTVDVTHVPESLWHTPAFISEDWCTYSYQSALILSSRVKRIYY